MKKVWLIIIFFCFFSIPYLSAEIGVGATGRWFEPIFSSSESPSLFSNYGVEFDWSKNHFGLGAGVFHKFLPKTSYESEITVTRYNMLDAQLAARVYFMKYHKGFNPFFNLSGVHRFLLTSEEIGIDVYDTILISTLGFDWKFNHLSIMFQAGIVPLKYMESGSLLYVPENLDLGASLSIYYRF